MSENADNGGSVDDLTPEKFPGLAYDEPMAARTAWRTGGKADRFYRPVDTEALAAFLRAVPESEPLYWIGLGSNLLVRDGGIRGTVISLTGMKHIMERRPDGEVYISASVPCAKVARMTAQWGLGGAEFLAGIPGTLGGALAMNAGAWGSETWQIVERAETVNRQGEINTRRPSKFKPAYRKVTLEAGSCFTGAYLRFTETDSEAAKRRISELLRRRASSQPSGQLSCGSVFKNPENDYAGRLIEACGLKGHIIGGAVISNRHANFIINIEKATAADIENLVKHARAAVREKFDIDLVPEVKIIGEALEK